MTYKKIILSLALVSSSLLLSACKPAPINVEVNTTQTENPTQTPVATPTATPSTTTKDKSNEKPLSDKDDTDSLELDLNNTVIVEENFN